MSLLLHNAMLCVVSGDCSCTAGRQGPAVPEEGSGSGGPSAGRHPHRGHQVRYVSGGPSLVQGGIKALHEPILYTNTRFKSHKKNLGIYLSSELNSDLHFPELFFK